MSPENLSVAELDGRVKLLSEAKELDEWQTKNGFALDDLREYVQLLREGKQLELELGDSDAVLDTAELRDRVDLLSSAKELERWLDEESSVDIDELQARVNLLREAKAVEE